MPTDKIDLKITALKKEELPELVDMARKAFIEAFTEGNKPENVSSYLDEAFAYSQIAKEFEEPASHFYVAKLE
ncbi:MAG TPA: hypothetical protein DHU93_13305, partial [Algoriphagus sp.]|nr:hypothetical protein [Algoriphagus sp.]